MYPRPVEATYLGDYRLAIAFEDGVRAELDFSPMVLCGGEMRDALRDLRVFGQVRVDAEAETLVWPNGADICPDVLYHLATGAPLPGSLPNPPAKRIRMDRPAAIKTANPQDAG